MFDSRFTRLLHLVALLLHILNVLVALCVSSRAYSSSGDGTYRSTGAAMEGAADDCAEYGASNGGARHRAWRLRGAHHTNAAAGWQAGRAGIKSRLLHGPEMAFVAITILLFRRLIPERIRVDD
jgi:hypothetical protein